MVWLILGCVIGALLLTYITVRYVYENDITFGTTADKYDWFDE